MYKNASTPGVVHLVSMQHKAKVWTRVQNYVKSWKKIYVVVRGMLSQSGFSWDVNKKMISEDHVWQECENIINSFFIYFVCV